MKRLSRLLALCALLAAGLPAWAADRSDDDLSRRSWKQIALRMPDAWYATPQAHALADSVLAAQLPSGGWFKNLPYHRMEPEHRRELARSRQIGSTIFDNDATTTEMRFLAKVYAHHPDARYAEAFGRALDCIFAAQYANGGWPMFYPLTEACLEAYGVTYPVTGKKYVGHITFNDNAIVNILVLLREIFERAPLFAPLTGQAEALRAREAFYRGVQCILDCQIRGTYEQYVFRTTDKGDIIGDRRTGDGPLTVWCAQHDAETLEPAQARAYEFPSYCGGESADILALLMSIEPEAIPDDRPDMWEAIRRSVVAAVEWFDAHRIEGKRFVTIYDQGQAVDRLLVDAPGERNLWARFYELTTCRPIFGMYDFVRRYDCNEVEPYRRRAYGWYSDSLTEVMERTYPAWRERYF